MIVGQTLETLLYAWRLQKKCILLEPFYFHEFDERYSDFDFSEFNASSAKELRSNLMFMMSMSSLLMYQGDVSNIRAHDSTIVTKRGTLIPVDTEIEYFDGQQTDCSIVYDAFHWRVGKSHDVTEIEGDDDFCKRILFYQSRRECVRSTTKDFTVVSKMTNQQIADPDYSQGMVRIKTQRMFKENDIKGEFSYRNGDKEYYKKVKFDFAGRIVVPILKQKMTFEEVFNMKQTEGEAWKTWKKLTTKESTWLGLSQ